MRKKILGYKFDTVHYHYNHNYYNYYDHGHEIYTTVVFGDELLFFQMSSRNKT